MGIQTTEMFHALGCCSSRARDAGEWRVMRHRTQGAHYPLRLSQRGHRKPAYPCSSSLYPFSPSHSPNTSSGMDLERRASSSFWLLLIKTNRPLPLFPSWYSFKHCPPLFCLPLLHHLPSSYALAANAQSHLYLTSTRLWARKECPSPSH